MQMADEVQHDLWHICNEKKKSMQLMIVSYGIDNCSQNDLFS